MAFSEVLIPNRPMLDRITASNILEEAIGRPLKIRFSNQEIVVSDAGLQALAQGGTFSIGVGKGRTYWDREINGQKLGSETAIMIYELRQCGLIPAVDPVLNELSRMMDRDNDRKSNDGGYLLRQPYAVGWIAQQGYRLSSDPSEIDFLFDHEEVVRRTSRVIRAFINAAHMADKREKGVLDRAKDALAMKLLPEGNARSHYGPMTVSRYIRDMFVLGFAEKEMVDCVRWFVEVHDRAKARKQEAKELVNTHQFPTFSLGLHDEKGTWADSDDPYLLSELVGRRHLVAMRSSRGNVIVMSEMFDLAKVGQVMCNAEPGRWKYIPGRQNIVANGTESVDMVPSGQLDERIQGIIGQNVVPKTLPMK